MAWQRSRVAMWVNKVARVTYRHLAASTAGAKGGTGPLALPKLAISPNGRRHLSEPSQVSLPTESYTTFTPWPSVIWATRSAKSSAL